MKMLVALCLLVALPVFAQPPTLGADCGTGATIVGSAKAGKVTIGANSDGNTCTLTWPAMAKEPSCAATLESGFAPEWNPTPYATISTTTSLTLVYPQILGDSMQQGNVISYLCITP